MNEVRPIEDGGNGSIQGNYHIEATESLVERTLRTLKHNDMFAVFDSQGNLESGPSGPDGIYYRDTRYLSHLHLTLGGVEPLQLGSVLLDDNCAMVVDLTNADLHLQSGAAWMKRESLHIQRFKFLGSHTAFERIRIRGFTPIGRTILVELSFDNDFADLFEVRGETRQRRGSMTRSVIAPDKVEFTYVGLDNVKRRSRLHFSPMPARLGPNQAAWDVDLDSEHAATIAIRVDCATDGAGFEDVPAPHAFRSGHELRKSRREGRTRLTSTNPQIDAIISRAWADLDMLISETRWGPYPYAGIPWYSTVFGRDGIITALQTLWCAPAIANGVLRALSDLQATAHDPDSDAQPGKIVHELRDGEMARLKEVPFGRYYGTVDATPLYVMLAAAYFERTADRRMIESIWPNILAALRWIDEHGDPDGDGLVEYARMTETGLSNQGWKDSADSIFHADGRLATGPIALCEVQAYVFAAKRGAAALAAMLGEEELSRRLAGEAETLRERFEQQFWIEELGTYALALDGNKVPCAVASSNAGHTLFCGIAAPERAKRVAKGLMAGRFFSGWGVRTIAAGESRYNPMSYHNGSVWPHDNALIAMGFARYGLKDEVARLFKGLIDAAAYDDLRRLPELFCGFPRRKHQGPTSYPVACSPQAWASGTIFAFFAAASGIKIDATRRTVDLDRPVLPEVILDLEIRNLQVLDASVAMNLTNHGGNVIASVLERAGEVEIRIIK